ncbi:hypothetical protein BDM02DRAFT_3190381 [Thelephora ganbajun]|uniref:Uncharacterized protein n=1 Tax=Thelephora ganbajun TaxID=370292 RepID=A0ACB6Z4K1_THEGA|nr:hypothetical protein BDM02DRAFT_3190381 [Thelephora ganbajun]
MSRQPTVRSAVIPVSTQSTQPTQSTPELTLKIPSPSTSVSPGQLPDVPKRDRWGWMRRYPVPITFSTLIFFVLLMIMIMLLRLNSDVEYLYGQVPYNVTGVAIVGHNYLLDLDKRTLSIQWEVIGCGAHKLSTYQRSQNIGASETCGPFDRAIDVYLNDATKPAFSFDPDHLPVSSTLGALYIQSLMSFGMEHQLNAYPASIYFPATKTRHLLDQQLTAPFDRYVLSAFVFVIDTATNQSVSITRFASADPLNHFITHFTDAPTTNKFTYDAGRGPATVDVESRALELDVRRSLRSRGFTMCMWVINWALTSGTVYITLVVLVNTEKMSDGVLALPITVILTIPTIRGLYVGTQPFDVVGFFLQIIIVALCSLTLLYLVIKPSPPKDPK